MIKGIIYWSIENRFIVLLVTVILVLLGLFSIKQTPVDAIPDLSDVQVIIKTSYAGQSPELVEAQITYPLTTAMLSVPGAQSVRGFSFYGDSYVYVIFDDDTDLYWARSRVLEYLSQVSSRLPEGVKPELGPDATGVGWVYIYSLIDKSGQHDLSQLRSLQDWFLKYELQAVPGVAEVATVGGMIKQYQINLQPEKLRAFGIPVGHVQQAIKQANQETGASVIELAEAEYMLRVSGYISDIEDLQTVPLGIKQQGVPLLLRDVAFIGEGPAMRRGIAELNGQGEVVGGIIVMRHGENALATIDAVKAKLKSLKTSLPQGVELVSVYDRSQLIINAVTNLWHKLAEEFVLVALVCLLFLWHIRSSLVLVVSLPVGILCAFLLMNIQGINANIMSLGGVAIAIGAMIDGAIVMVENLHKHKESHAELNASTNFVAEEKNTVKGGADRWQLVAKSASEVGPALFFSLLIITVSFTPVFFLEAQEGRMFKPLAFTKTYAMAAAAVLAITLVPVLMGYFVRGRIYSEHKNPLNRMLSSTYRKVLKRVLHYPRVTLVSAVLLVFCSLWPLQNLGSEFMPTLDEGDLMYMPTTYPGISIGKARQLLQQTDKLIATVPEVESVFGKIGRADTATDPAPLTMIETFVQLKPKSQWREGMSLALLKQELEAKVSFPGLSNAWVMPIKTRIDMLATGVKTPVAIKISGPDLELIQDIGRELERILSQLDATQSVYSERVAAGRYLDIDIKREQAARLGLNISDIQQTIAFAVGGKNVGESVEGLERYPINIRYPQAYRDSPEALALLPIVTDSGARIALADVADIRISEGPVSIKSENARVVGWTLIDIAGMDVGAYVKQAQELIDSELTLPVAYSLSWAGQYEYMQRVKQSLSLVIPLTLIIIVLLLFLCFKRLADVLMIIGTLPLALVGSLWLVYGMGFNFSTAVAVGMIALAGVAVEIGVIMLLYLNLSVQRCLREQKRFDLGSEQLRDAVLEGAVTRIRPVLMTTLATIIGLLPILLAGGTGAELMQRLAAPMVGGMVSALLLSMLVLPALYFYVYEGFLVKKRHAKFVAHAVNSEGQTQ
ncbi:efflux RND transporter permease subunit [Agaribacterium sp. ZY112]|uniref:efflux RND transporter permease subunit n=1 Tax=Agaribacterium sp. ZY112 TaxID=3233574 RepID=UPI00352314CE